MKITESNNELIWSDKPTALKLIGLIFSAVGLLLSLIALSQFLDSGNYKSSVMAIQGFLGVCFILGGFATAAAFKNTEVTVNRLMQQLIYKHGKILRKFALSEIDKIEYMKGYDSDKRQILIPILRTKNGERLTIYRGALSTPEMDNAITKFNSFLHKA
jgi:hypothetical protein